MKTDSCFLFTIVRVNEEKFESISCKRTEKRVETVIFVQFVSEGSAAEDVAALCFHHSAAYFMIPMNTKEAPVIT